MSADTDLIRRALRFVLEAGEPAASAFRPEEFQQVQDLLDDLHDVAPLGALDAIAVRKEALAAAAVTVQNHPGNWSAQDIVGRARQFDSFLRGEL